MPRVFVVSVRDRATASFGNPVTVPHIGAAERSFRDEINNPESALSKHPEDYDLYLLGTFCTDEGIFEDGKPRQLAVGKDCVKTA